MQKYWNKGYNPWRKVVLWGIDNGNPSLLILYGKHNFIGNSSNILTDDVEYTSYAIFRGENGHFPSYQAVRIIDESDSYYNRDKNVLPRMYYRQGTRFSWSWHGDSNYEVEDYYNLKPEKRISFPYFELVPYRKYVERINNSKILLRGLVLLEDPYELIGLQGDDKKYEGAIFDIIMNQNIYMKKIIIRIHIEKSSKASI